MGQVGSAMGNSNTFAPDPSGFSGSEWAARLLAGATKGGLQGYSNMEQQNAQMRQGSPGGAAMQPAPAQPSNLQFGSQNFTPQGPGTGAPGGMPTAGPSSGPNPGPNLKTKNPYFYGYGEGS